MRRLQPETVIGVAGNPKLGNVDRTSSADVSDKSSSGDPDQCFVNKKKSINNI